MLFPTRCLTALVVAAAIASAGCQGAAPGAVTPNGATNPALAGKKTGTITGTITQEGLNASAFRLFAINPAGANATVAVHGDGFSDEVTAGPDGRFSIVVPGGADYTLTATCSDGHGGTMREVATVTVPLADEPPIVDVKSLVTRRTGSIQGLIELPGGASAEGADVFIGGTTIVGKASQKGRFALANVPEGIWDVVVQKPGFARVVLEDLAVEAGKPLVLPESVQLAAEAAGSGLKATLRDAAGKAVVGATLTAFPKDPAYAGGALSATSDDQGNVSLNALPAGDYQVQIYRSFYTVPPRQDVTIKEGVATDLGEIKLTSTTVYFGQLSGQAVDETGDPVDGAVVMLDPPVTEQIFTDAQGRFTLDRVMPGDYTLHVAAGGMEVYSREVRLDNAPNTKVSFDAPLAMRTTPRDDAPAGFSVLQAGKRPATLLAPAIIESALVGDDDVALVWDDLDASQWPTGVVSVRYQVDHLDDAEGSVEGAEDDGDWKRVANDADVSYDLAGDDWEDDEFRVRAVGKMANGSEVYSEWKEVSLAEQADETMASAYSVAQAKAGHKLSKKVIKKYEKLKKKIEKGKKHKKIKKGPLKKRKLTKKKGKNKLPIHRKTKKPAKVPGHRGKPKGH